MSKAHLLALFGLGCAANSLLTWLAALHPNAFSLGKAVYGLLIISLMAALMLDDSIYPVLGIPQTQYYGALGLVLTSMLLGSGLIWLAQ